MQIFPQVNYGTIPATGWTLFVNTAAFDFRVLPGSPAIDAGTDTGIRFDRAGVPRPQHRGYDIGAYELTGPAEP